MEEGTDKKNGDTGSSLAVTHLNNWNVKMAVKKNSNKDKEKDI